MTFLSWFIPWEPSIAALLALAGTALAFRRGGHALSPGRKILFWTGLLSLYAVGQTQFDYYSEHEFFVHRIQHGVLQHFGPFLIALSHPGQALMTSLPERLRAIFRSVAQIIFLKRVFAFLMHPAVLSLTFSGLIVLWLVPPVLFLSMLDWRLYRLMEGSMVINGLMFWSMAFDERISVGPRMGAILAVIPVQIAAGALLVFAPRELYPVYSICGRAFASIDALDDQKIGGLILWIHGAMMSVIGILIVARQALIGRRF
jgi:putative membrane protein